MKYSNTSDNSDHMALNHTELFLIPYMKEKNLWINAPVKELDTERYPVKKLRIDVKNQKLKSLNNDEIVRKSGPASRRRLAAAGMPSPRSPLRSRTSSLAVAMPNSEPSKSKNDVKTSFVDNPLFHSQVAKIILK